MLYIVPTPLGNLEDMTQRALAALRGSAAILCEDTRRTRALLSHFGIRVPAERYNERDPRHVERALERLAAGRELALVSDSGTPVVSDPGWRLVARARAEGLAVASLPGPCAAAAAVAGSGLPGDSFVFLGFLPRSPGKRLKALAKAAALDRTIVVYESPFRVADLLRTALQALGSDCRAALCRELTKVHEEWLTGSVEEVLKAVEARPELKGECVLVLRGVRAQCADAPEP